LITFSGPNDQKILWAEKSRPSSRSKYPVFERSNQMSWSS
jgi:hypothetical protein